MKKAVPLVICALLFICGVAFANDNVAATAWPVFDSSGYYESKGELHVQNTARPVNTARPIPNNSDKDSDHEPISGDIILVIIFIAACAATSTSKSKKRKSKTRNRPKATNKTITIRVNASRREALQREEERQRKRDERELERIVKRQMDLDLIEFDAKLKASGTVDLARTLNELEGMKGRDFEYFVAELLMRNGYKDAYTTPASGDYGADVIAIDPDGEKVAIQCKLWQEHVGNKAVQEAYSAMTYYDCKKSMVITNSTFTSSAKATAKKTGTILYDKNDLLKMMNNTEETEEL